MSTTPYEPVTRPSTDLTLTSAWTNAISETARCVGLVVYYCTPAPHHLIPVLTTMGVAFHAYYAHPFGEVNHSPWVLMYALGCGWFASKIPYAVLPGVAAILLGRHYFPGK